MKHETQCIHTFEINYRRCKICSGQDTACRCYEPRGGAEKAKGPERAERHETRSA